VIAGTRGPQRATMKLDVEGKQMIEECEGNGPVDAVFNCVKAMVPHEAVLELYQVHAVTEGRTRRPKCQCDCRRTPFGHLQGRRSRHAGCVREGLSRCTQQADHQAQPWHGRDAVVGERRIHSTDVG